ncbi:ABC transporter ATP-binding protein/permease (plasmid) [Streptomyces viridifaciens]|nr:ABC transporter ATP-binding protein/permease [Streptomyces viridifaciens]
MIGQVSPALATSLLVAVFAVRYSLVKGLRASLTVMDEHIGARRRGRYLYDLVCTVGPAKEIRTFGLGEWIVDRFRTEMHKYHKSIFTLHHGMARREAWLLPVCLVISTLAFLWSALAAFHGLVPVKVMTSAVMAFAALCTTVQAGQEQVYITPARLALQALCRIERMAADGGEQAGAATLPGRECPPLIRFSGVCFGYERSAPVINGLDLEIRPGEVLAIVGVNGAGKTTLTKLLAGLYPPQEGQITADGVDIGTLDTRDWQSRLAIVFQDFVKYQLSLRENIALASPAHANDEEMIRAAIREAGASDLVDGLPKGWDTPLSRSLAGGIDLSGGQWQKVAIARALFAVRAGASVLVLDEPTAHLDIRAELAFFSQVIARVTGISVVLISHRLSTVRQADRIVLLEEGRVSESGTHEELLAMNGTYSEMFELQAARFRQMDPAGGGR